MAARSRAASSGWCLTWAAVSALQLLSVVVVHAWLPAGSEAPVWPSYGGDAFNSRNSPLPGPVTDVHTAPQALWQFASAPSYRGLSSPVLRSCAAHTACIFVTSGNGTVFALNGTGSLVWSHSVPVLSVNSAGLLVQQAPQQRCVFIVTDAYSGNVTALDCDVGAFMWNSSVGAAVRTPAAQCGAQLACIGSIEGRMFALNTTNGSLAWSVPMAAFGSSGAGVSRDGSVLYTSSADSCISAFSASNQSLLWRFLAQDAFIAAPLVAPTGTVYAGSFDMCVYALNGSTGALVWKFNATSSVNASLAMSADGSMIFAGTWDGHLFALSASNGSVLWSSAFTNASMPIRTAPATDGSGAVYVGRDDGLMYAFNGSTGSLLWAFRLPTLPLRSSPAIGEGGSLLLVANYTLFAIAALPPPMLPPAWQSTGHDSRHTGHTPYASAPATGYAAALWTLPSGSYFTSPVISQDDFIFVGNSTSLLCLQPNGSIKWQVTTPGKVIGALVLSSMLNAVYVPTESASGVTLFAFTIMPGDVLWQVTLPVYVQAALSLSPDAGTLYMPGSDGAIYALSTTTGHVIYSRNIGAQLGAAAVSWDGTVIAAGVTPSQTGVIAALNGATGAFYWLYGLPLSVGSPDVVLRDDGTVLVPGMNNNNLYALDVASGILKWVSQLQQQVTGNVALSADGTIYTATGSVVWALDGYDGTPLWSYPLPDVVRIAPLVELSGTIYVGCNDGNLYALNPTGTLRWSFFLNNVMETALAMGSDGTLYAVSVFGNLWAIVNALPARPAAWPLQGCDSQRSNQAPAPVTGPPCCFIVGLRWVVNTTSASLSAPAMPLSCSGVVAAPEDRAIVSWSDGSVIALVETISAPWWAIRLPAAASAPSIGVDGTVFFGCNDSFVYALAGESGRTIWRAATLGAVVVAPVVTQNSTTVAGSILIAPSIDGYVHAFDATNGTQLWVANGSSLTSLHARTMGDAAGTACSPASLSVDNSVLYGIFCAEMDGVTAAIVYALTTASGAALWTTTLSAPSLLSCMSTFVVVASDSSTLYVRLVGDNVTALEARSGAIVWSSEPQAGNVTTPLSLGSNGILYVPAEQGSLVALAAGSGAVMWTLSLPCSQPSAPSLDAVGIAYIVCHNVSAGVDMIAALQVAQTPNISHPRDILAGDGNVSILWTLSLDASMSLVRSAPTIAADNSLLVATTDGRLLSVGSVPAPPQPSNSWFAAGHDSQNTGSTPFLGPPVVGGLQPSLVWTFNASGGVSTIVTDGDDNMYFTTAFNKVVSLAGVDGSLRWEVDLGYKDCNGFAWPPVLDGNGTLFVNAGRSSAMVALDATTGSLKWALNTLPAPICSGRVTLSADGTLYARGRNNITGVGFVYAVDAGRGELLWTVQAEQDLQPLAIGRNGSLWAAPAILDVMYSYSAQGTYRCSVGAAGTVASPITSANGLVFYTGSLGSVYAALQDNCNEVWQIPVTPNGGAGPALALSADQSLLFASYGSFVLTLDALSGKPVWLSMLPGTVSLCGCGPPVIDGVGVLWINAATTDFRFTVVYAMDARSGMMLANTTVNGTCGYASPSVGAQRSLFMPTESGIVYAWRPSPSLLVDQASH